MTMLLILHAQADVTCAEQVRTELEVQGYRVWREPRSLSLNDPANPRKLVGAVLGCAAVILVWSKDAAQSSDVTPYLTQAQQLLKPVYTLLLDNTPLPQTFTPSATFAAQAPYTNVVAQLIPQLPSQQSTAALLTLYAQAAHEHISVRKEAITLATEMLQRGQEQARVQIVLQYLGSRDTIMSVREMAVQALVAGARTQTPSAPPHASSHIVDVSCPACKHINHFDKHIVCKAETWVYRGKAGKPTDHKSELYLECKSCKKPMVVSVDCRGYE